METITCHMVRKRALETAHDIAEEIPEGERHDAIPEFVEAWDWNIYSYYIDQVFLLAVQWDDQYIEMVQANHDMEVDKVKLLVACEYSYELVYAALRRIGAAL